MCKVGNISGEPESSEKSDTCHDTLMARMPGLRQSLGGKKYPAVLELGCKDVDTCRILTASATMLYVGMNTNQTLIERMQNYYERYKHGDRLLNSGFFKRDILQLEDKGSFFDLICINSLDYHFTVRDEAGLKELMVKLLRHGRKVIFHAILADELGHPDGVSLRELMPPRVLSGIPSHCFHSIMLYQGIAQACSRKMHSIPGQIVEVLGVRFETTYLVFE